jgi:hypothetical protein
VYRTWCEAHQFCLQNNMVLAHPLTRAQVMAFKQKYGQGGEK